MYSEKHIEHSEKYREISLFCTMIYTCSSNICVRKEPKVPDLKHKNLAELKYGVCCFLDNCPWRNDSMLWNLGCSPM